jgi:hypothetical protein
VDPLVAIAHEDDVGPEGLCATTRLALGDVRGRVLGCRRCVVTDLDDPAPGVVWEDVHDWLLGLEGHVCTLGRRRPTRIGSQPRPYPQNTAIEVRGRTDDRTRRRT